jgi:cytochrome c oxidase assembly protein subunit 15
MLDRLPTLTPERYHRIATWTFVLLTVIVFSGAAVRLTGSGLGCPDWPRCTPADSQVNALGTHTLIEFGNRIFSGLVGVLTLVTAVLGFRRRPFRRDLMLLGLALPLGVVAQAVLGGLTVLYDLRPGFVMGHFGLSMIIEIAAWALYWRSRPAFEAEQAATPDRGVLWASRVLAPVGAVVIFAGTAATAAGPHAGGAGTHDVVKRLYLKGSGTLDWAIRNHAIVAAILGMGVIGALAYSWWKGAGTPLLKALGTVVALLVLQGVIGATQYALELPAELVWVHVGVATCTWVSLLWVWSVAGSPAGEVSEASPAARSRGAAAAPGSGVSG